MKSFKRKIKKSFKRKVKKNFTRSYQPKCCVCHKVLQNLVDLRWHRDNDRDFSDHFVRLQKRVNESIVVIRSKSHPEGAIYRHNRSRCEVGGSEFMKNEELVEQYEAHMGIKLTANE